MKTAVSHRLPAVSVSIFALKPSSQRILFHFAGACVQAFSAFRPVSCLHGVTGATFKKGETACPYTSSAIVLKL